MQNMQNLQNMQNMHIRGRVWPGLPVIFHLVKWNAIWANSFRLAVVVLHRAIALSTIQSRLSWEAQRLWEDCGWGGLSGGSLSPVCSRPLNQMDTENEWKDKCETQFNFKRKENHTHRVNWVNSFAKLSIVKQKNQDGQRIKLGLCIQKNGIAIYVQDYITWRSEKRIDMWGYPIPIQKSSIVCFKLPVQAIASVMLWWGNLALHHWSQSGTRQAWSWQKWGQGKMEDQQ